MNGSFHHLDHTHIHMYIINNHVPAEPETQGGDGGVTLPTCPNIAVLKPFPSTSLRCFLTTSASADMGTQTSVLSPDGSVSASRSMVLKNSGLRFRISHSPSASSCVAAILKPEPPPIVEQMVSRMTASAERPWAELERSLRKRCGRAGRREVEAGRG